MTLNLYSKSQSLFILKTSASLTQMIIIADVVNVLFKHHDQDMIFLDAAISLLESNIYMFFESVVLSTFVVFTKFTFILLDQTCYDFSLRLFFV